MKALLVFGILWSLWTSSANSQTVTATRSFNAASAGQCSVGDSGEPPSWKETPLHMPPACVGDEYVLDFDYIWSMVEFHSSGCPHTHSLSLSTAGWLKVDVQSSSVKGTPTPSDVGELELHVTAQNDFGAAGNIAVIPVETCN